MDVFIAMLNINSLDTSNCKFSYVLIKDKIPYLEITKRKGFHHFCVVF